MPAGPIVVEFCVLLVRRLPCDNCRYGRSMSTVACVIKIVAKEKVLTGDRYPIWNSHILSGGKTFAIDIRRRKILIRGNLHVAVAESYVARPKYWLGSELSSICFVIVDDISKTFSIALRIRCFEFWEFAVENHRVGDSLSREATEVRVFLGQLRAMALKNLGAQAMA
uniref:Uncharacterized protein n=1 Tax=Romanomermis culicivorax TaxID=13658 RepID=A0A915L7F9_ROMCU